MSREKKYTHGPWFANENLLYVSSPLYLRVVKVGKSALPYITQKADIRLISASPELLEALEGLLLALSKIDTDPEIAPIIHLANKAISKAYGEEDELK